MKGDRKLSEKPNYFNPSDFEPYVGKMIPYLVYVYPRGTGKLDHGRYLMELEEFTLEKVTGQLLVMKYEGSLHSEDPAERKKYTDIYLVPISQIVEIRINLYLEE